MEMKLYTSKKACRNVIILLSVSGFFWLVAIAVIAYQYFTLYSPFVPDPDPFSDWLLGCLYLTLFALVCSTCFLLPVWVYRHWWGHVLISEDAMCSVIFFKPTCRVDRQQTIYYAISKVDIDNRTQDKLLFVSNSPFDPDSNALAPDMIFVVYDPSTQIALPYNSTAIKLLGDDAVFLGESDLTGAARYARRKKARKEKRLEKKYRA